MSDKEIGESREKETERIKERRKRKIDREIRNGIQRKSERKAEKIYLHSLTLWISGVVDIGIDY